MQDFKVIETPLGLPICLGGKIHESMAQIAGEVQAVGKTGENHQQRYKYRPVDEFMNALNPIMAKHQVSVRPFHVEDKGNERVPTNSGGSQLLSRRIITYLFQHADGSFVFAQTEGLGMDSGDKASNKAMAFAFKYLLMQSFVVPTSELKDPDAESPEMKSAPAAKAPTAPPAQKAPAQKAKVYTKEMFEKAKPKVEAYLLSGKTKADWLSDAKANGFVVGRDVETLVDSLAAELIERAVSES